MTTIIKFLIALILALISQIVSSQEIVGIWNGVLSVQGADLPIVITVAQDGDVYTSTLKSPKQSPKSIPVDKISFVNGKISLEVNAMAIKYEGTLVGQQILGTFTQGPEALPLNFQKGDFVASVIEKRYQEPVKPYPYASEDIIFTNDKANGIALAGTLTLPKDVKNPPVVILISGSGPQDRNSTVFDHKPFLVLSDHFTRQGIAVLRYDERGVGESDGEFANATSLDFASDVEAAIAFLKKRKDIDVKKIGLVGHSEGGFIAPMVASRNKDVAFVISLAGTGVSGKRVLITQAAKALELLGASKEYIEVDSASREIIFSVIEEESDKKQITTKSIEALKVYGDSLSGEKKTFFETLQLDQLVSIVSDNGWMQYFIKTDPVEFLSNVTVPVLAINGSRDFQVVPELNLQGFKDGLTKAGNKDVTTKELKGLNHLFQNAETGALSEYKKIAETFDSAAMTLVSDWILNRF